MPFQSAGGGVASIGGAGTAVVGGAIVTLASGSITRNTLDDGAGNMVLAGNLNLAIGKTVNTDNVFSVNASTRISLGGTNATVTQGGFFANAGFGAGAVQTKSANYNMVATDFAVYVTTAASTIVITLKSNGTGTIQVVQKVDAGAGSVTLTPDVGTIDGAASKSLNVQNMSAMCQFDGTNWHVIAVNTGVI